MEVEDDFIVIGSAASLEGARSQVNVEHPDIAVIDVNLPGGGWDVVRLMRATSPNTRLVAYSGFDQALVMRTMVAMRRFRSKRKCACCT